MLIDPMGGIVITNDGYCIQREIAVSFSTAKSLLELSRAQDKNVSEAIYKHYQVENAENLFEWFLTFIKLTMMQCLIVN